MAMGRSRRDVGIGATGLSLSDDSRWDRRGHELSSPERWGMGSKPRSRATMRSMRGPVNE